jgi:hypothetical protein
LGLLRRFAPRNDIIIFLVCGRKAMRVCSENKLFLTGGTPDLPFMVMRISIEETQNIIHGLGCMI